MGGDETAATATRVLVVDDDADLREVARLMLELAGGFEVSTSSNGRSCVEAARRDPPDVILLDARMPDMDGPETFAALAAGTRTRPIPVVFLTGTPVDAGDGPSLARLPHAGVVRKPFTAEDLVRAVETATGTGASPEGTR